VKFEYAVTGVEVDSSLDAANEVMKHLDELGAAGWELISVDRGVAYLRREKAEPKSSLALVPECVPSTVQRIAGVLHTFLRGINEVHATTAGSFVSSEATANCGIRIKAMCADRSTIVVEVTCEKIIVDS
jgi:hypothetical protein